MKITTCTLVFAMLISGLCLKSSAEDDIAQKAEAHTNLAKGSLALQGYDPVAYFKEGGEKPTLGKASLTHMVGKTIYRFATEANRDRFKSDAKKYTPAYGGWCAYAMGAKGEKVEINPKAFVVTDGQLFLFYKTFITDTRKAWNKDTTTLKPKADTAWKTIISKKAKSE